MTTVLVVGATGQLGSRIVARLSTQGRHRVRALTRRAASGLGANVDARLGDLRDPESLLRACEGVDVVVATATVVFPRGRATFRHDEEEGYAHLIDACRRQGVRQFIFVSLSVPFESRYLRACPTYRTKASIEARLVESGMDYTILRCPPFMDDYFALMGSRLPLLGEPAATLDRATGPTRWLRSLVGDSIERWGIGFVPGPPDGRHAFIALEDVASFAIASLDHPEARRAVLEVSGPEALAWRDVAALYAQLLRRPVRLFGISAALLRLLGALVRPFSEILANQLAILWILGERETAPDPSGTAARFGVSPTRAASYLQGKFAHWSAAP